jgi:alpha-glucuronidase
MRRHIALAAFVLAALSNVCRAEDGGRLWLRYDPIADTDRRLACRAAVTSIVATAASPTLRAAADELQKGVSGLLGATVPLREDVRADGAVIAGTPRSAPLVKALGWNDRLAPLGDEGFIVRSTRVGSHAVTAIAANSDAGVLYGVFHFLRLIQTGAPVTNLDVSSRPRLALRLLDHWDNLDGSVERGYAGTSIWWPDPDPRAVDYARADASIGINGAVLNNVNADPRVLTAPYLRKAAAIAATLRPYGIRVYLAANAAAPRMLHDLSTADPLDPGVARWWRAKADEIYALIPDFGGFVVKANSEGQPGPQDYGRTHADGANVLADALAPHGGVVMWRAFVYDAEVDADRVKRAYREFVPLDGHFRDNVFVQVKNGPLDFQPREPFHPLFGAMPKTPLMAELQITQEYLGQSTHLVYLAPMWKEFLDADTYARGSGSTVAKVVDGTLEGTRRTGIAGVANTGRDANWTGHDFAQANWYAFGRLAWDPALSAEAIADEWIRMTWTSVPATVAAIRTIMLESREAIVRYSMPLGLHHLIGGNHYAPMPENADPRRPDWSAVYYHHAGKDGVGFDRTTSGSGAVTQYFPPLRDRWNDPATTPDALLLWFHHVPWTYTLRSGRTVWEEILRLYNQGVDQARGFETTWIALKGSVDAERHAAVLARLRRQASDAAAWRDKSVAYFQQVSGQPPGTTSRSPAPSPRRP